MTNVIVIALLSVFIFSVPVAAEEPVDHVEPIGTLVKDIGGEDLAKRAAA